MAAVLVVDDEPGIRQTLASILGDEKYRVFCAEDAVEGTRLLGELEGKGADRVGLVFLDVLLPRLGGLEALGQIRERWPAVEVVMISGHANVDMAVRAVKGGAFDFLEKPLSLEKTLTVCRNALALGKLRAENRGLKKSLMDRDEIIGSGEAMGAVRKTIRQAASGDARVLITGENGVGKELVARAIHRASPRADRPFVELNCAAIPEALVESELFGHEKGAFTDAVSARRGRFEAANGGTLFLDEIGDMSLSAQAKVLRVIQEQRMERLGGEKTIETDARLIAATNMDLEKACDQGRFRRDLFFRLNVVPIRVPPLRERLEDVLPLLRRFLDERGLGALELDGGARDVLLSHDWPGNVRELKNLAERIAVMRADDGVDAKALAALLGGPVGANARSGAAAGAIRGADDPGLPEGLLGQSYNDAKKSFEKRYLEFHVSKNRGIISKTAEAIGIYPSNLHIKLKRFGIAAQTGKEGQ